MNNTNITILPTINIISDTNLNLLKDINALRCEDTIVTANLFKDTLIISLIDNSSFYYISTTINNSDYFSDILEELNEILYDKLNEIYFDLILEEKLKGTGRTTRLIDFYIQKLFNNKNQWIEIKDHYNSNRSNSLLKTKIINRLSLEHKYINIESNGIKLKIK